MSKKEITTRETDSLQFSKEIMNGHSQAALMNATVQEGKMCSIYVEVMDGAYVAENWEAVSASVNEFFARVRKMAAASDLPL